MACSLYSLYSSSSNIPSTLSVPTVCSASYAMMTFASSIISMTLASRIDDGIYTARHVLLSILAPQDLNIIRSFLKCSPPRGHQTLNVMLIAMYTHRIAIYFSALEFWLNGVMMLHRVPKYLMTSGMCPLHCRMMYDYGY